MWKVSGLWQTLSSPAVSILGSGLGDLLVESWFSSAAEKVVREGKNLYRVLIELNLDAGITQKEAESIYLGKEFQLELRLARNRYFTEMAKDANFGKDMAVGAMLVCIDRLMTEGKHDKALDGLQKLAKLKGWLESDVTVNVLGKLSDKDIEEAKRKFGILGPNSGAREATA